MVSLDFSRAGKDRKRRQEEEEEEEEEEEGRAKERKSDFSVKKWQGGRQAGRDGKADAHTAPPMESLSILRNMERENPDSGQQGK
jgi:hypothetical protein